MSNLSAAPRIVPLTEDEWAEAARDLPEPLVRLSRRGKDGPPLRIFTTLGRHPDLLRRWMAFAGALLNGTLPARDREMVILRTAWLCQVDYEWGPHRRAAAAAGLSDEDVERIITGPAAEGWSPFEQALLEAADELHHYACLSDATWKELAALLDEQQLIELLMLVGNYHVAAYTLSSIGVAPEDGFETLPRR
jgi:4-carboxymuconolactone decarboxylase